MNRVCFFFLFFLFFHCAWAVVPLKDEKLYDDQERKFDADFKERYSGRKYNYDGDAENRYATSNNSGKDAPYKNREPRIREERDGYSVSINNVFTPIAIIIVIVAVVLIVYLLLNEGSGGLFSGKRTKKLKDEEEITAENIAFVDLNTLIANAENEKNYRLAIRYNYLSVLKQLSLKGIIDFEDEKTNRDYQNEIKDQFVFKGFSYVSYLYNYIWYGEFKVDTLQYEKAKSNFTMLIQKI